MMLTAACGCGALRVSVDVARASQSAERIIKLGARSLKAAAAAAAAAVAARRQSSGRNKLRATKRAVIFNLSPLLPRCELPEAVLVNISMEFSAALRR